MTSERTVLVVVGTLAVIAFCGVLGTFMLLRWNVPADRVAIFTSMVGPAIGALGALLVSTRSVSPPPAPEDVEGSP